MLKTARLENPKLTGQIIGVEPGEAIEGIIAKLKENARIGAGRYPMDTQIKYQDGQRMVADWHEVKTPPGEASIPWKDGGIYLITGGAGGSGIDICQEIARKVKEATLILTGRSRPEDKQAQIKNWRPGAPGLYTGKSM